jgi:hypothetical protein
MALPDFLYYVKQIFSNEKTKTITVRIEESLLKTLSMISERTKISKTDIFKLGLAFIVFLFTEGYYQKIQNISILQKKDIGEVFKDAIDAGIKKLEGN